MPMAPIPFNSTARVFLEYGSVGYTHTIMFRLGAGASTITALTKAIALANVLKGRLFDSDAFQVARYAEAGEDFSLPLAFSPVSGTGGDTSQAWAQDPESTMLSFVGRGGTTGRRARWEFFTGLRTTSWPTDNRYSPGDSAPIDALRINFTTWVNTSSSPGEQVVTLGGDIPTVYGYVNISQNSYWQRKQR